MVLCKLNRTSSIYKKKYSKYLKTKIEKKKFFKQLLINYLKIKKKFDILKIDCQFTLL